MSKVKVHKYLKEISPIISNEEFVVLDIETTTLSPTKGGFIIEIAAQKIRNGEVVEVYEQLINPGTKVYGKTIELTGITNEMLKGQPTYAQALPKFYDFIGNAVVVGHNMMFDWDRFLIHYFNAIGIYPKNVSVCTKKMFRALRPERVATKLKFTLSDLTTEFGVEFDEENHHRALYDTEGTAISFMKMVEETKELFQETGFVIEQPLELEDELVQSGEPIRDNINVTKADYWEKTIGKRHFQRIYVKFNHDWKMYGEVFFDIPNEAWIVKNFDAPIDLEALEKAFLQKVNCHSIENYLETIGALKPKEKFA